MRDRRHPARSGTTTSAPKCTSGKMRIRQPPGPSLPKPYGRPINARSPDLATLGRKASGRDA